jgi:hypothetical protein
MYIIKNLVRWFMPVTSTTWEAERSRELQLEEASLHLPTKELVKAPSQSISWTQWHLPNYPNYVGSINRSTVV